jgi:uncharacterized membrane protein SirB2
VSARRNKFNNMKPYMKIFGIILLICSGIGLIGAFFATKSQHYDVVATVIACVIIDSSLGLFFIYKANQRTSKIGEGKK